MQNRPRVTAVVVAFGDEPWLERSIERIQASHGVDVDVVIVDNGCTDGAVDRLERRHGTDSAAGVAIVRPGNNLGFAEGCNVGAGVGSSALLALVNPDALVEPSALLELCRVAAEDQTGIATAAVVLADHPDRLNSGGNEVHFLGSSWSGSFDEPLRDHLDQRPVAAASGAAMVVRRDVWAELGGFCGEFFAYFEDADLSLRAWAAGHRVVYVPTAVVVHRYEFSRNERKSFLIDRNRMLMTATCFGRRHLLLTAPLLVLQEIAITGLAVSTGWWPARRSSVAWMVNHARWIRDRRRDVQAKLARSEAELAALYSDRLDPQNFPLPAVVRRFEIVLAWYWRVVRRWV
jgi:GT2 family glycosyltransferase